MRMCSYKKLHKTTHMLLLDSALSTAHLFYTVDRRRRVQTRRRNRAPSRAMVTKDRRHDARISARCRSVLCRWSLVSHVSRSVERGLVFRCLRPSAQHTGSFTSIPVLVTLATGLPFGFSEPSRDLGFDLLILLLQAQVGVLQGLQPREEG